MPAKKSKEKPLKIERFFFYLLTSVPIFSSLAAFVAIAVVIPVMSSVSNFPALTHKSLASGPSIASTVV